MNYEDVVDGEGVVYMEVVEGIVWENGAGQRLAVRHDIERPLGMLITSNELAIKAWSADGALGAL